MTESTFAAIGVVSTIVIVTLVVVGIGALIVSSLKDWLHAKRSLNDSTDKLMRTQRALMDANNRLNERVRAIEEELRGKVEK